MKTTFYLNLKLIILTCTLTIQCFSMETIRTADGSRLNAFNSESTIREANGYSSEINGYTKTICEVLSDESKVSSIPAEDKEKEDILKAVIAGALTDLTYNTAGELTHIESMSKRKHPNPYATCNSLQNKKLFQHFSILHDMDYLSREIFANNLNQTITDALLKEHGYKNLYAFSGLNEGIVARWFNEVLKTHGHGLSLLKILSTTKHVAPEIDVTHYAGPSSVEIAKLKDGSLIYATAGIQPSPLHSAVGYALYPNLMALGTTAIPRMSQTNTFSIAAEVKADHYLIIMKPSSADNNVLLPAYGEVSDGFERGASENDVVTVDIQSSQGVTLAKNTISWNTSSPINDGALQYETIPADDADFFSSEDATYSFFATVSGSRKRNGAFYYWCPTAVQMSFLKAFSKLKEIFTLQELLDEISTPQKYNINAILINEISNFAQ